MEFQKQLKKLLESKDMSASDLSRKVGISVKTIHNWLTGQAPRDINQVKKVANYFETSVDMLCFGVEAKESPEAIEAHRDEINAGIFEVVLRRVKK